ncbi:hypothetical protein PIB30_099762, partial [Stylosanthes scabra]|nr:hypothetical protein [Stylosanthes scabra]
MYFHENHGGEREEWNRDAWQWRVEALRKTVSNGRSHRTISITEASRGWCSHLLPEKDRRRAAEQQSPGEAVVSPQKERHCDEASDSGNRRLMSSLLRQQRSQSLSASSSRLRHSRRRCGCTDMELHR